MVWAILKKVWSALLALILVIALAIMISPLPEGTIILSLILSYFGYRFTGSIQYTLIIYAATFITTIIIIGKLHLVARFKAQLEKIRS